MQGKKKKKKKKSLPDNTIAGLCFNTSDMLKNKKKHKKNPTTTCQMFCNNTEIKRGAKFLNSQKKKASPYLQ